MFCMPHSVYQARTWVKRIRHFELACDRILNLKDEDNISDEEQAETVRITGNLLDQTLMQSLKHCNLLRVERWS